MRHKVLVVLGVLAVIITAGFRVSQSEDPSPRKTYSMFERISREDSLYLEQYRLESYGGLARHEVVPKIWLEIKALNKERYANPDLVMPGDTILLPLGMIDVARFGGQDHMWRSAEVFFDHVVIPYVTGEPSPGIPDDTHAKDPMQEASTQSFSWQAVLAWLGVASVLMTIAWVLTRSKSARKNFVQRPPKFRGSKDGIVQGTAQDALQTAFGRGIRIIGPVVRGFITGRQRMFNRDGTTEVVDFKNEPGFQALVRFDNGQERLVVCRWSCFNPCYNCVGAEFNGTFTPVDSNTSEPLPVMRPENVGALQQSIMHPTMPIKTSDLPGRPSPTASNEAAPVVATPETPVSEVPTTDPKSPVNEVSAARPTEEAAAPTGEVMLRFKELQISNGRLTANGDLAMSFRQFSDLIGQVTKQKSVDEKADVSKQ